MEQPKKEERKPVTEKFGLYPKGTVDQYKVDSLKKVDPLANQHIGKPKKRYANSMPVFGEAASDYIKKSLKKG